MFSNQTVVVAAQQQMSSDLAGEVIILDLNQGSYYGLDQVGALIWKLIQAPCSLAELRAAILAEYEVEPARCERDLLALVGELARAGLVEVRHAAAA